MGKAKMIYKTFTIAVLQALTIDVSANQALQGGAKLSNLIDDNIRFALDYANGQVVIDQADINALSALLQILQEYDPAPVCDNEQTWNEHVINGNETVYDYLVDWFHNSDPPHECVTDDYRIWMLDHGDCHCAEIQRWMVGNLEELNATFEELEEDVEANRPWMHDNVQRALFDIWGQCFPNWREEVELQYTDAEINADVIRSLVPVESDICPGSHTPVDPPIDPPADPQLCPDGTTDPAEYDGIENLLWWFYTHTSETEPTDWDCVLNYVFEESGSHCEIMRDTTADIIDSGFAVARPWMQPETVKAFERHWNRCFKHYLDNNWENMFLIDENSAFCTDDIRDLVPEDDL